MLSVISAPPPPIVQILKLTLPRALTYALTSTHPTNVSLTSTSLPSLDKITSTLTSLSPAPGLIEAWTKLHEAGAKVILVTNGSEGTTRGYVKNAGLEKLVDRVASCDDVGAAKPDARVYARAHQVCFEEGGVKDQGDRWFVACHTWDLAAARYNGCVELATGT
jgi:2-haloacid dehalogenase